METRDHILMTALIGFIQNGFDRISLNEIIKRTDLTKGAFYYHFSSKDELIEDVIEIYLYQYIEKCMGRIKMPQVTPNEKLELLHEAFFNEKECLITNGNFEHMDKKKFFTLFLMALDMHEGLATKFKAAKVETLQSLTELMDECKRFGVIKADTKSQDISELMFSCYRGVMFDWITGDVDDVLLELKTRLGKFLELIRSTEVG